MGQNLNKINTPNRTMVLKEIVCWTMEVIIYQMTQPCSDFVK